MIKCKKIIIATCLFLTLPVFAWTEAPVVDDSDNFAMLDEQQQAQDEPVASKYNDYAMNDSQDDGPALAKEDNAPVSNSNSGSNFNDNAKLIDKVQSLQQEIQELRGQLEVQAHDLKLLQEQQLAFYKDLDTRLGSGATKSAAIKPATEIGLDVKPVAPKVKKVAVAPKAAAPAPIKPAMQVSRANPADEQIGYLAAYELVKDKHYDEAIEAMQSFAQKYPQGGYTANAEYWLGELYMVKKDYAKAIEHFDIVLNQFPSSSKSAASMLKSGYAYYASGDNDEATKRLRQVIKNYPDTPTAQLAKSKLESIKSV
jgi:tol-pal system protein YbgF